jgi:MFS transporter, CP family, cyanate transporter
MKRIEPSSVIILAGVTAALSIGKLPPALPVLRESLHISLVQAGFLLSLVQLAGMTFGLAMGLLADGIGHKRSMVTGLLVLCGAGALGGFATDVESLLALRALEGVGLLMACMPGPGLLRRVIAPARLGGALGLWGACMPFGVTVALLLGPATVAAGGWQGWWWLLAGAALSMALWVERAVPADALRRTPTRAAGHGCLARLRTTLGARGPWLVAGAFFLYSCQWLAVIGFLPTIYAQAGLAAGVAGALTALAAAANIAGNVTSGRLLQRGLPPQRLLYLGFGAMGAGALLAFSALAASAGPLSPFVRYAGVLLFSACGGVIPATLFVLAVKLAPGEHTVSTTVGWMQQWSAFGQVAGPPLIAWIASAAGNWHWTWIFTGTCALAGMVVAATLGRSPAEGFDRKGWKKAARLAGHITGGIAK